VWANEGRYTERCKATIAAVEKKIENQDSQTLKISEDG